ncbi:retinoic acid receptor beta-like [Saccoglossus kowalevskii]
MMTSVVPSKADDGVAEVSSTTMDVVCVVCSDKAAGKYFGAIVCEACKSFFIRSTKKGDPCFYCVQDKHCQITPATRLLCQYCRFHKCLAVGMTRTGTSYYLIS